MRLLVKNLVICVIARFPCYTAMRKKKNYAKQPQLANKDTTISREALCYATLMLYMRKIFAVFACTFKDRSQVGALMNRRGTEVVSDLTLGHIKDHML